MMLGDRVVALDRARQEEDRLLDVRGEQEQVHDLRDPGAADHAQAGQVGVVLHFAGSDQPFEADRQSQQPGDSGYVARFNRFGLELILVADALPAVQVAVEMNAVVEAHLGLKDLILFRAHFTLPAFASISVLATNDLIPLGRNVIRNVPFSPS